MLGPPVRRSELPVGPIRGYPRLARSSSRGPATQRGCIEPTDAEIDVLFGVIELGLMLVAAGLFVPFCIARGDPAGIFVVAFAFGVGFVVSADRDIPNLATTFGVATLVTVSLAIWFYGLMEWTVTPGTMRLGWDTAAVLLQAGSSSVLIGATWLHWVRTRGVSQRWGMGLRARSSPLELEPETTPYEEWKEEEEELPMGTRVRGNDWFLILLWIFGVIILTLVFSVIVGLL